MVTRRNVLAGAAALGLLPLAARNTRAADADLDVAVIGGGASGAYTAWRLRTTTPQTRVRLFEMSDRIGGRLRSIAFPQAPHLFGEAGGMRFLEAQRHVFPLVKHLGLPAREYPIQEPQDRLALRGRSFAYSEIGRPDTLFPYNIPAIDQAPNSDLYIRAMERIFPGARRMTADKWRKIRATVRYKGRLLKDWSAWTLFADAITHEEIDFLTDSIGYDDLFMHETGLDAFDYTFLGDDESKTFYTIPDGYQRLPQTLASEAGKLGAPINMQTQLVSLVVPDSADGVFTLGFVDSNGRLATLTASRVVLAMPRHAIETIANFPALNNPKLADLIASVDPVPACKALLLYPNAWWSGMGIEGGRSITDMPARQFFALGAEHARMPMEPSNGYGMLMMYCDANSVEYWREMVDAPKPDAAGFQWLDGNSQLASEVHRQAGLVFNTAPPAPLAACFQDWTADPFGGGWHFWGKGKDSAELAGTLLKPIPDRHLYICGEAYAAYAAAGWVEGALERAETMLQKHFALPAPDWLKA
ncbi:MAG TPA: FAD-dependent oxidoreductase [Rhizomicrobium sp.]|jgi:monoamine oxidase|nr:FAD-dependent oxidoreductase [Rhizomicrobium sp.]